MSNIVFAPWASGSVCAAAYFVKHKERSSSTWDEERSARGATQFNQRHSLRSTQVPR
ncbi:hypothetical protein GCM10008022_42800 [Paenibacillus hunanensis]|nr:hypothetical protein GCM10008022_42800 [Paenibacillus hunanensis]